MATFRKRPVVIEAWTVREILHAAKYAWGDLPKPVVEGYERGDILFTPQTVQIKTREGWMVGDLDDKIIQGVKGELYPCKPDVFVATYDLVSE